MTGTLILLVGSNPMPNYLSACALRPERVALVYSAETKDAKDRLRQALSLAGAMIDLSEIMVDDPTCATDVTRKVGEAFDGIKPANAWLNYTGGTKIMAAHARMAFKEKGCSADNASYLDEGTCERAPCLRFDDGTSRALTEYPDVSLTLETILRLHGLSYTPRPLKEPAPTAQDATAILGAVLAHVPLASCLYRERQRLQKLKRPAEAAEDPFQPNIQELRLSIDQLPTHPQMNRAAFEQWCAFIGGEWLEEWLGAQITALHLEPDPEIVVGVNAQRGGKKANLEVDIAVVRGHRSYVISCTTDTTKSICKSKLFEIAIRSRQLGGELARAALVCLGDERIVGALQDDINDVWGATNTTRVFGLSDLKTWSGHGGASANTTSLRTWLES